MIVTILILIALILLTAVIGVIILRAYLILIAKNQVAQIEELKKMFVKPDKKAE